MIVVNRFRVDEGAEAGFRDDVHAALAALTEQRGYLAGHVGRNVDEPDLWLLTTTWANVGSYRRALSSYDVKLRAVPLLARAVDEPSAYEIDDPGTAAELNVARARETGAPPTP